MNSKTIREKIIQHEAALKKLRNELKIAEIKLEVLRPSKDFEKEVITKSDDHPILPPQLLDLKKSAAYLSVCPATIRDWARDGILKPVRLPGSCLRDKHGNVIARPSQRKIGKLIFELQDLKDLIQRSKEE